MAHRRCAAAAAALPRIVDARGSQNGSVRDGIIEAVARTPILGFRDDVVVRVRATTDGARIDVRSASRYGRHDFGTNAARVRNADRRHRRRAVHTGAGKPEKKAGAASRIRPAGKAVRQAVGAARSTAGRRSRPRRARPDPPDAPAWTARRRRSSRGIEPDIDRPAPASGYRLRPCRAGAGSTPRGLADAG